MNSPLLSTSTPNFSEFDPKLIPMQYRVLYDIRKRFDYTQGTQEILLSGSVGSAKSILVAHMVLSHCLLFHHSRVLAGRLKMQDLKETLLQKILEHMRGTLVEGKDYRHNKAANRFYFRNGSEIASRSWYDKDFKKFRSLELSAAAIEEGTESDAEHWGFYDELYARVGRLQHVPEKWIMMATNPDSPRHPVYKHFISKKHRNRHVYYSKTEDNPFLPKEYIQGLKDTIDPKMAKRLLYGEWTEINEEVVYYAYTSDRCYRDYKYEWNDLNPIDIAFDFNIGNGKPMSACAGQVIANQFHVAKDFVVAGARTLDILEEMAAANLFENRTTFRVFGDSTGARRDTRSIHSDYDIIMKFLQNYKRSDGSSLEVEKHVPRDNPAVRKRHNLANAHFLNEAGATNFFCYSDAQVVDEGLRLTKLKKGGQYLEDDSDSFQHVTTAVTYWIHQISIMNTRQRTQMRE